MAFKFFKAIWNLLKLSLFKEPTERGENILGPKRKGRRSKVANRCGKFSAVLSSYLGYYLPLSCGHSYTLDR
jgi:hypothetical protein